MVAITHICTLTLKPNTDISKGEAKEILDDSFMIIAQQPGLTSLHYGRWIEEPDKFDLVMGWRDLSDQEAFLATGDKLHTPFVMRLASLTTGTEGCVIITRIEGAPSLAYLASPFTELGVSFIKDDVPSDTVPGVVSAFFDAVQKDADGVVGYNFGWLVDEAVDPEFGKAKGLGFVFGLKSLDARDTYRETEEFKKSVIPFRKLSGNRLRLHHVTLTEYRP